MATTTPPKQTAPTPPDDDHLTPADRAALGKAAREDVPRTSHAAWAAGPERDPMSILCAQDGARVPELVPIRYGRMLVSPFTFYRGAAALMAADLAGTPASGLRVQAVRRRAPLELRRLRRAGPPPRVRPQRLRRDAARARSSGTSSAWRRASRSPAATAGCDAPARRKAVVPRRVRRYREAMRDVRRDDEPRGLVRAPRRRRDRGASSAARHGPQAPDERSTRRWRKAAAQGQPARADEAHRGRRRRAALRSDPPLLVADPTSSWSATAPSRAPSRRSLKLIRGYKAHRRTTGATCSSRYRVVDIARKVVGVGSVGTRAWVILLLGRDESRPAGPPGQGGRAVGARALLRRAAAYRNHGQRVVEGQRLMQAASDIFLGWQRVTGLDGRERDFYVRQLWDWQGLGGHVAMRPEGFCALRRGSAAGRWRGRTRARATASRSPRYLGGRQVFDERSRSSPSATPTERARLRGAEGGRGRRPDPGRDGRLTTRRPRRASTGSGDDEAARPALDGWSRRGGAVMPFGRRQRVRRRRVAAAGAAGASAGQLRREHAPGARVAAEQRAAVNA